MDNTDRNGLVELTADVISAFVSNNPVRREELGQLISDVHSALAKATGSAGDAAEGTPQEPAVSVRTSIKPDFIVCLEDGKKFKSLKRHLRSDHNLTPEEYRAKWNLRSDYPMVAANYAQARSELARSIGLGQKKKSAEVAAAKSQPAKRTRRSKAAS